MSCNVCKGSGVIKKTVTNKARQTTVTKKPCKRCGATGEVKPVKEKRDELH